MAQAVNNFNLTGNIAKDPEIRTTQNGKKYAFITIAVNRLNNDKADFISFVIWEKLAETVVKYCSKGDCISVLGFISVSNKDGNFSINLTGDSVTFLHKAQKKAAEPKQEKPFEPENDNFQASGSVDIFAPF